MDLGYLMKRLVLMNCLLGETFAGIQCSEAEILLLQNFGDIAVSLTELSCFI